MVGQVSKEIDAEISGAGKNNDVYQQRNKDVHVEQGVPHYKTQGFIWIKQAPEKPAGCIAMYIHGHCLFRELRIFPVFGNIFQGIDHVAGLLFA